MTLRMTKWLCAVALAIGGGSAFAQDQQEPQHQGMEPVPGSTGTTGQTGQGTTPDPQLQQQQQQGQMGQAGQQIRLSTLGRDEVKQVQQALQRQGFYTGQIDGIAGPETYAALGAFQKQNNAQVTGHLDMQTAQNLGVSFGDIQPVRGGGEDQPIEQPKPGDEVKTPPSGGGVETPPSGGGMETPPSGGGTEGGSQGGGY